MSKKLVVMLAAAALLVACFFSLMHTGYACNCDELSIYAKDHDTDCAECSQSAWGIVECDPESQHGNLVCVGVWYEQCVNTCEEYVALYDWRTGQEVSCITFYGGDDYPWVFRSGRTNWGEWSAATVFINFPCTDHSKAEAVLWMETCTGCERCQG